MSFKDPSDLPKLGADYKLRNIDSAARAEFLKLFLWLFCPLSLI